MSLVNSKHMGRALYILTTLVFAGLLATIIFYNNQNSFLVSMLACFCFLIFIGVLHNAWRKNKIISQLSDSRSYLKNIVDNVADPIFIKDRQHRWIDGNTAFWELMNKPQAEVVGKSDYEFFPKEEADVFWEKDEEVFTTNKININEESFTDSKGEKHTLSTKKAGFKLANGAPVLVGIIRDITELRRTQEKLKESDEARLKSIMEHSGRPVYIKDLDGVYTQVNRDFCTLMAKSEKEILGKTDFDLVPAKYAEEYRKNEEAVVYQNKAIEFEEHSPPNIYGDELIFTSVKFPIYDANDRIYATCGISTDITQRKKAEETVQKALAELKRANTELERFAYVCSHDLQEPLRTINSFAQLLQKQLGEKLDATTEKYLNFIIEGSVRARDLIVNVLEYSRLDIEIQKHAEVDMDEVIGIIEDNLKTNLKEMHAELTHDKLPVIMANKTLMIQLFQNLIQNAVKFSDKAPKVHIGVVDRGEHWEFRVTDNGIGIAPQYHSKIFEVFQRLNKRHEYPGTGVGLAICKKIIEMNGGRIWLESELGKGSSFIFTVPK